MTQNYAILRDLKTENNIPNGLEMGQYYSLVKTEINFTSFLFKQGNSVK